jgi:endo-1,4-beta-xylanase
VQEWDVVNEPFDDDGTLKSDLWAEVIGPRYIALAFRWAHEADPAADLFINEYNVDWDGPKQRALLDLLARLKEEGVPVDGVGMEEHLSLSWSPSSQQISEAMRKFAALGLDVAVTEMDVGTRDYLGSAEEAEDEQADVFAAAARACRTAPSCLSFSVWGVSDAVSWLGPEEAGLPFDDEYEAKPAWLAIENSLESR